MFRYLLSILYRKRKTSTISSDFSVRVTSGDYVKVETGLRILRTEIPVGSPRGCRAARLSDGSIIGMEWSGVEDMLSRHGRWDVCIHSSCPSSHLLMPCKKNVLSQWHGSFCNMLMSNLESRSVPFNQGG